MNMCSLTGYHNITPQCQTQDRRTRKSTYLGRYVATNLITEAKIKGRYLGRTNA